MSREKSRRQRLPFKSLVENPSRISPKICSRLGCVPSNYIPLKESKSWVKSSQKTFISQPDMYAKMSDNIPQLVIAPFAHTIYYIFFLATLFFTTSQNVVLCFLIQEIGVRQQKNNNESINISIDIKCLEFLFLG